MDNKKAYEIIKKMQNGVAVSDAEMHDYNAMQFLALSDKDIQSLDSVTLPEGLQRLDLSSTPISSLDRIKLPSGLKTIRLDNLRLKSIPESLVNTGLPFILDRAVSDNRYEGGIYLHGTKLTEQDINLFRRDRATIEAYYRDLEANTERQLNECKVILLGDGEVGKTYIIDRISNNNEKLPENHKTDTTKGILLSTVQTADGESIESDASKFNDTDLKIRFWDFGGQQIMHSMHRCFLTSKTIYVIVVSGRQNELTEKVHYWLTTVAAFAKDSPVIIVTNKSDQYRESFLDRRTLKADFPNIREFIRFSALTSDKAVFAELPKKIYEISANEMMFSYPAKWLSIKDRLEHMSEDYITDDDYRSKCESLGIDNGLQDEWLNWFNDLSIMFRCPGKCDALDTDYMVLKPQWLINAIYSIICTFDDDKSEERNGQISHLEILDVLKDNSKNADPSYKGQYDKDTVRYVIRVMQAFGISYELRPDWEFIPTLCRKEKPDIAYEFDNDRTLKFLLRYSYLPENVLYRFMIKRKEHLNIENAWYHGALFDEKNGCSYIVSQDYGDGKGGILIRINTTGDTDAQMVLGEIVTAIRGINEQIGLSAEEYIVYSEGGKDYPVDYNDLWTQKNSGKELTWIKELKGERKINDVLKCAVRDEVIDFIGRKTERDDRIPFEVYKNAADALKTAIETIKAQNETIVAQQETINSQQKFFEKSLEEMSQLLEEYEQSGGRPKSGWFSKVRVFFTGLHNTIGGMLDNGNKALEFMQKLAAVYALYSLVQK